ncbi:MAG: MarR family transcriptional regulator [Cytophagales bacterium]|nr:MarR family transcriptional regulator [Rhizobacter sp.]
MALCAEGQTVSSSLTSHELLTQVLLAVFRVNGRLLQKGDEMVAPLGLTSARWQILGALALANEARTAPEIGGAMGITRQAAQKQLNLLLGEGLVDLQPNPRHQRSPLYILTAAGDTLFSKAMTLNTAWTKRLVASMSKSDVGVALDVLDQLHERLGGAVPQEKELK